MPSVSCKDRDTDKTRARNKEREKLVGLEKKCSSVTDPLALWDISQPNTTLGRSQRKHRSMSWFYLFIKVLIPPVHLNHELYISGSHSKYLYHCLASIIIAEL